MKPKLGALLFAILPISLMAKAFDNVQINTSACTLVRSGTGNKDILASGKVRVGKCFVVIPASRFFETYSFCALSGVLASGRVGCEFGYYDEAHANVSFISDLGQVCEFVCAGK